MGCVVWARPDFCLKNSWDLNQILDLGVKLELTKNMEGKSQPFRKRAGLAPFSLGPPHLLPVKCPKLCVHGHDLIRGHSRTGWIRPATL